MYAVYSTEPVLLERVLEALPSGTCGMASCSWNACASVAPRSDCIIVASRWVCRETIAVLRTFAFGASPVPVVLVTTKDADNARVALQTGATRIVWLGAARRELVPILQGIRTIHVLNSAADLLQHSTRLSTLLRLALAHACRAEPPLPNVAALARLLGRDRRTLWRHWNRVSGGTRSLRLEDFLAWVFVLHAKNHKAATTPWAEVANAFGTHVHTLARKARHVAGTTLTELECTPLRELESRFLNTAVQPLVTPGP